MIKTFLKTILTDKFFLTLDVLVAPLTLFSALWMKLIRRTGVFRLRVSHFIFNTVGVFPIRDYYYEPLFNLSKLKKPLNQERDLSGIDWNDAGQLELLANFHYNEELLAIPKQPQGQNQFYYKNPNFTEGDAEYLYNMIRYVKPSKIIEVGSGFSTLMAKAAIAANVKDDAHYHCQQVCIEPYEMPWLEQLTDIEIVRSPVEEVDAALFASLGHNDFLFIDSSHVIRPQGDVLVEYLTILPRLAQGVLIHFHDIFTPRDYPEEWLVTQVRLWNEQYLLEAFISFNSHFEIIASLNYLKHRYPEKLATVCPVLAESLATSEPGSFWLRKVR
ncbi:MAG: class I SAM-dependent methyltransferase [Methylococcales bacterium]